MYTILRMHSLPGPSVLDSGSKGEARAELAPSPAVTGQARRPCWRWRRTAALFRAVEPCSKDCWCIKLVHYTC